MKSKFKDLATSLDILNTVHGGVSEPYVSLRETTEGREIHVRVPGIRQEAMHAEIVNNNQLSVFYFIPVISSGTLMQLPRIVFHEVVPDVVDVLNINSTWEENDFIVRLPFNTAPDGNHRKIAMT